MSGSFCAAVFGPQVSQAWGGYQKNLYLSYNLYQGMFIILFRRSSKCLVPVLYALPVERS